MAIDTEKAIAELKVLRDFVDFVNAQVQVYMDCLAGFEGNKARVERQVARVTYPTRKIIKGGQTTIVLASVENPSSPDAIHHRIIRSEDFVAANSESGFNERQVCWSIIVFMFAYWNDEVRPKIANIRNIKPDEVMIDELGDLRIVRNCVVHDGGVMPPNDFAKLRKMQRLFQPNEKISLSHDQMHQLFISIKQAIGKIILTYTGDLPGAPDPSDIVGIAIQTSRK
jgi:hypothetical protein